MIDFRPTSTVELRPLAREEMGWVVLYVDVAYNDLDDLSKPILSFRSSPGVGKGGVKGP